MTAVWVAISLEDVDAADRVAEAVLDQHAGETGIVWIFFSYTAETCATDLRVLGVRYTIPPQHRPQPVIGSRAMAEITTLHRVRSVTSMLPAPDRLSAQYHRDRMSDYDRLVDDIDVVCTVWLWGGRPGTTGPRTHL